MGACTFRIFKNARTRPYHAHTCTGIYFINIVKAPTKCTQSVFKKIKDSNTAWFTRSAIKIEI